uniref:USP domain-containing protein n=1 Tax=Eutreptiella gymnastica TaxID=73025 RepID=A0A7S1N1E2_9EUGL
MSPLPPPFVCMDGGSEAKDISNAEMHIMCTGGVWPIEHQKPRVRQAPLESTVPVWPPPLGSMPHSRSQSLSPPPYIMNTSLVDAPAASSPHRPTSPSSHAKCLPSQYHEQCPPSREWVASPGLTRIAGKLRGRDLCVIRCSSVEQALQAVILKAPCCIGFTYKPPFPTKVRYIRSGYKVDQEKTNAVSYLKNEVPVDTVMEVSEQKRNNKIKSLQNKLGRRKKEFNNKFLNTSVQNTVEAPQPAVRGEKGLLNEAGANNCFLNVVLQALWHLDQFRQGLLGVHVHQCCGADHCLLCAMQALFTEFIWSSHLNLPPDDVRLVVSRVFADVEGLPRFQVGAQADAAELLDAVLLSLHDSVTDEETCNPWCFAHTAFGGVVQESTGQCPCGSDGETQKHRTMLHYFPASLLHREQDAEGQLEAAIHKHFNSDVRTCGLCGKHQLGVRKSLQSAPVICAFVLAWTSSDVSKDWLHSALHEFPDQIDLLKIYDIPEQKEEVIYDVRGFICFYGGHYVCFFFNVTLRQWIFFDDSNVRVVGTLQQVTTQMVDGRLLPLVLFYNRRQKDVPSPPYNRS